MSCVIEGCKSHTGRQENDQVISFHRFPKNKAIKDQWMQQVNRKNWNWNKRSHICSKHFTPNSFIPNSNLKWRRLKPDAIPTLHIFASDTLETGPACLIEICDIKTESCADVSLAHAQIEVEPSPDIKQECDTSAPIYNQMDEPICNQMHEKTIFELQRKLERVKKISRRRLQKINTLTKRLSRLGRKTNAIYCILMDKLKTENVETDD